ncbi:MAG: DNA gyrase subunit A, partial [Bacilli bacterium]|nr:DNA gyrase subunit A [Bacilli bacterium]
RMRGYQIPDSGRTGKGLPVVNFLNLDKDERVVSILACDDYPETDYLFFVSKKGTVKRTALKEFASIHTNGKIAAGLKEDDELLDVKRTNGEAKISLASSEGKVCCFPENEVRPMGRTAAGVRGIDLEEDAEVVGFTTSVEGELILVLTAKGFGKMSYAEDREITDEEGNVRHYDGYRQTHRGTKGVLTLKITPKNGKLVALRAVNGDEDLVVITTAGIVMRTPLTEVKIAGRNTQGVKIINLEDRQKVASISIVPHEDPSSEEEEPLEGEEAEPAEEATNEEPVNPNEVI